MVALDAGTFKSVTGHRQRRIQVAVQRRALLKALVD